MLVGAGPQVAFFKQLHHFACGLEPDLQLNVLIDQLAG